MDSNQSKTSSKRRTFAMQGFIEDFGLKTITESDKPTFHHNNGSSESCIDHIYYFIPPKSNLSIEFKDHLCTKDIDSNFSSHDVFVGTVSLPPFLKLKNNVCYSNSYTDFIIRKSKWNASNMLIYQENCSKLFNEIQSNYSQPEYIPEASELLSKALVQAAQLSFDTIKPAKKKQSQKIRFLKNIKLLTENI